MKNNFLQKFYYGDIPEEKGASGQYTTSHDTTQWPLWEVFIRSKNGLDHKHAGSLHAADAQMAIENARDVYTRRMEGVSIWLPIRKKPVNYMNLLWIKYTGTLLFTSFLTK